MNTAVQKPLPPEPKEKHWLFGSGYGLREKPHQVIQGLVAKYGDIFSLTLPFTRLAVAASPEYARYVLLDNNKNYRKSLAYELIALLLGNGLLTSEGEFWKKQRKLIQPAFHKRKLDELTAMMVQRTEAEVEALRKHEETGEYFDVTHLTTQLTLDIISKAIFSSGIDDKAEFVADKITQLNLTATEKLNSPIRLPQYIPTPTNLREKKTIAALDEVIYNIINQRKASGESKSDLLSMLLDARDEETGEGMDPKQLRDEIMTIFIAGNETTANALAWVFYLLSQHPEVEQKMCAEVDEKMKSISRIDFTNVNSFVYVKQVIEESMRLYPPAWMVGRRNYEDDEIGGYRIIKNTNVLVPIYYLHRSEKYWTDPEVFNPDRFAPEKRNSIDRFVYMPFGGGPRFCIGNNFALLEMQIIVALFYSKYTFRLKPGFVVEPEPLITMRPKYGMMMKVVKR